jgi:hypothetical protein
MLQDTDLDAAVAQGIVTSAQADALRDLARQRAAELSHEERFRFLKGFNDVFFTIGVVLFLIGAAYYVANYAPSHITGLVVMAVIVWVLAEFLVARMRLVLPGILLALAFVGLVLAASVGVPMESRLGSGNQVRMPTALSLLQGLQYYPGGPLVFSLRALVPAAAAAAFYWRFKLPFALLPLAASLVIAALGVASFLAPQAAAVADTIVFLLCGLGVFAAAMSFDISDRERLTRRADCAFWLHLLAAPLIMHSVISLATRPLAGDLGRGLAMSSTAALAVIAVVAALALVALLIDRRALLVSGLAYLGVAIALILRGDAPVPAASVLPTTLVILGGIVLTLGAGWVQLRRLLLALVPPAISNRLPPVPARP